ncbi:MAG TPA: DsbA family protein [Jiangellaceae bacterium]|nr:DsbA family protein [Jiangellaceae bacterium]
MALTVYGDFFCLSCYLASQRVDALNRAGVDVEWRAIDHAPRLSVTAQPIDPTGFFDQLTMTRPHRLPGETLPDTPPSMRPRSVAAIAGFAEAVGAGVQHDVLRLLFAAYWQRGEDIGNPEVLRTLLAGPIRRGHSTADPLRESGYCVSMSGAPVTTGAYRRIRGWVESWHDLGAPPPPVVVEADGAISDGMSALARLGALAGELELGEGPGGTRHEHPGRTEAGSRPSPFWVSEVGGRWAQSWMAQPAAHVRAT